MFDAKFWRNIELKYLKAYRKFFDYIISYDFGSMILCYNCVDGFNLCHSGMKDIFIIPFEMVYGLLEKFFDDNGIIIVIDYHLMFETHFYYRIIDKIKANIIYNSFYDMPNGSMWESQYEAKEQAIKKVFEILEEMENKK